MRSSASARVDLVQKFIDFYQR